MGRIQCPRAAWPDAAFDERQPRPADRHLQLRRASGSGHAARAVGSRLRSLAQRRQLLCITHLPQIASLAERHFAIVKDTRAGSTSATVTQLAEQEVVSELVRMLGAEDADSGARSHARELRRAA